MKVDHMKGVVIFGNLGIESDGLKDHLAVFAESLNKVRAMLYPVPSKASKLGGIVPNLADTVEKEHKRLLARKSIIEKRKEDQERQQLEMEREEEQKRLKLQKLTEEAEQKRLAAELQERRKQRILREIEQKELEEAQALLEDTEKRMKKGKKKTLLDGEKVTKQNVMQMALTEQVKERQEMEKKLQKLAKTMDYLERAKREEAAPVIEAAYQRRLVEEREFYEREQQREVELSRERHESDLKEKSRLSRIYNTLQAYGQSKLCNILHATELARQFKEQGVNITVNSLHPGSIMTNLLRYHSFINTLGNAVGKYVLKSIPQGAATTCYAALHPQAKGVSGEYLMDNNISSPNSQGKDTDLAKKLWEFSLSLTGEEEL
ncbi:hypothetical protein F2Q70_00003428 [Brassica cretica]|uniref:Uncharacterized protein n=1 Tax=Brassica cretica TaxID=69181 RepID=A0A8S9J4R7_BRACR|nr:hypothetical protein F2Q70_00003428 [Brassica cretica]